MNIERSTSNKAYCQFKIKTEQADSAEVATNARSESTFRNLSPLAYFAVYSF